MYIVYTVVYFESSYCILMPLHIETYLCMAQMSWPGTHTLYSWPFYMLNMILLTSSYTVCTVYSLLCFLNKNIGSENNLSSSNRCRVGGGVAAQFFVDVYPTFTYNGNFESPLILIHLFHLNFALVLNKSLKNTRCGLRLSFSKTGDLIASLVRS